MLKNTIEPAHKSLPIMSMLVTLLVFSIVGTSCTHSGNRLGGMENFQAILDKSSLLISCITLDKPIAQDINVKITSTYCDVPSPYDELKNIKKALSDIQSKCSRDANGCPAVFETIIIEKITQIDDFLAVVDNGGELEAIDRCDNSDSALWWLSATCSTLKHACSGDFVCYDDDTCACYTCNGSSCGIN